MAMSEEKMAELFPTMDPDTWNGGTWPPQMLRKRWQQLFDAVLSSALTEPLDTSKARNEEHLHGMYCMKGCTHANRAARVADWALRVEVERGF